MINKILSLLLCVFPATAYAIDVICEVEYGGSVTSLKPEGSLDPYKFTKVDLPDDFRFSTQYLLGSGKLKTYVYHNSKDRYVLIHAAEYSVGENACTKHEQGFGLNKVYSAKLELELSFQCRLVCR